MSNWGRGTGIAAKWKTLTQGTKGKKSKIGRFILVFPLQL